MHWTVANNWKSLNVWSSALQAAADMVLASYIGHVLLDPI